MPDLLAPSVLGMFFGFLVFGSVHFYWGLQKTQFFATTPRVEMALLRHFAEAFWQQVGLTGGFAGRRRRRGREASVPDASHSVSGPIGFPAYPESVFFFFFFQRVEQRTQYEGCVTICVPLPHHNRYLGGFPPKIVPTCLFKGTTARQNGSPHPGGRAQAWEAQGLMLKALWRGLRTALGAGKRPLPVVLFGRSLRNRDPYVSHFGGFKHHLFGP